MRTTKSQKKYWQRRSIDWKVKYFDSWKDPHRYFISYYLTMFDWGSLIEVGVGGGANIVNIVKMIPHRMLGGVDINPDAIKLCQEKIKGGIFKVGAADDIMMSDKSADVLLSDMMYIYVGPFKINKHIRELRRVARNKVVLCEMYEPNPIKRIWLYLREGYFFHNWMKLLKKNGFYDIVKVKMPKEAWGDLQGKYCYLFIATPPKKY